MQPHLPPASVLPLLLLFTKAASVCVKFQKLPICPAESDKPQLSQVNNVESPAACQLICAMSPACSAVHFSAAARTCWLAASFQWWEQWKPAAVVACESLAKAPRTPQAPQLSSGLAMWFNFRYSLLNLQNASAAPAKLVNAQRNTSSVFLQGSGGSYVDIPVPSADFETLVGPGNQHSYYVNYL